MYRLDSLLKSQRAVLVILATILLGAFQPLRSEVVPKRIVGLPYPRFAHTVGLEGIVKLTARVSTNGNVDSVQVVEGHKLLAEAATESLSKWRFSGCLQADHSCEITITFVFVLEGPICSMDDCPSDFQADLPDVVQIKSRPTGAMLN